MSRGSGVGREGLVALVALLLLHVMNRIYLEYGFKFFLEFAVVLIVYPYLNQSYLIQSLFVECLDFKVIM